MFFVARRGRWGTSVRPSISRPPQRHKSSADLPDPAARAKLGPLPGGRQMSESWKLSFLNITESS